MGHRNVSAHTLLHQCTRQFSWLELSFAIYDKGVFSLIAYYSVIKTCFKILFGKRLFVFGVIYLCVIYEYCMIFGETPNLDKRFFFSETIHHTPECLWYNDLL